MGDIAKDIAAKRPMLRLIQGDVGSGKTVVAAVAMLTAARAGWQAALMALLICLAGFFGGLVMSAIKRDLGAKDWGASIAGHGGFMDRIDSLCFAAPLFLTPRRRPAGRPRSSAAPRPSFLSLPPI